MILCLELNMAKPTSKRKDKNKGNKGKQPAKGKILDVFKVSESRARKAKQQKLKTKIKKVTLYGQATRRECPILVSRSKPSHTIKWTT